MANDKANIQKAELDVEFTEIKAPFDGRIENTKINVGQPAGCHRRW